MWEKVSYSERTSQWALSLFDLATGKPGKTVTVFVPGSTCAQCPTPMSDFKSQELDISGWQGMRELVFTSVKIHRALVSRHNHRDQVPGQVWTRTIRMSLRLFRNVRFTVGFGWIWRLLWSLINLSINDSTCFIDFKQLCQSWRVIQINCLPNSGICLTHIRKCWISVLQKVRTGRKECFLYFYRPL